jgi:hypothetical protein
VDKKQSFSIKNFSKKIDALLKIAKNFHCKYFGLGSKFLKTKKVEFQNSQIGALLKVSSKLAEKSGVRH